MDVQDYLRAQQTSATSHDLVTEIFHFFQSLEPELDVNNVDQACKAVDTLTEMVQVMSLDDLLIPLMTPQCPMMPHDDRSDEPPMSP